MSDYSGLKRAATYLRPDLYQALREQAFRNERSVSSELKTLVKTSLETGMTDSETHMSMAMSHLRKVSTAQILGENKERLQDYVDAIETELARIKQERGLR